MSGLYYSRQYYNQLKRKLYKEYLKRQRADYLYKKKLYEEYCKRKKAYLYKKKYDEKHYKMKNDIFTTKRKYDEGYTSQSEVFNSSETENVEDNKIKNDSMKYKKNESSQIDTKENSLDTKKNDSDEYYNEQCNNISTENIIEEHITVKIPVILAECNITVPIQSTIKLGEPVLEIKHIKKNMYLNQCKLIPNFQNGKSNTGMLFISGFVKNNIEYSTIEYNDNTVLNGKLKYITVDVPFEFTTRVAFNTLPKFKATPPQGEVEILQTSFEGNPYEEKIIGPDIREKNFRLIEFFNEKIFCKLISAEFLESDILENQINKEFTSPREQTFYDITENSVIILKIELLQNQNVIIAR